MTNEIQYYLFKKGIITNYVFENVYDIYLIFPTR